MLKTLGSVAIISGIFSTTALAQDITLACQYTDASGFIWQNGCWDQGRFNTMPPFFMKLSAGRLDPSGAALEGTSSEFDCSSRQVAADVHVCYTPFGTSVVYNAKAGNGAVSQMFGALMPPLAETKDTVTVSLFVCQEM